ncbi:MAG: sulfurtransferase TusA family protein [Cyanobacteria bacterium]|nr:sulfurtransferase TusA family protein [Cyanobacteriota bacterium]
MNFVKTRLYLDKLESGDVIKVYLDAGEPVESVSSSIEADGHSVVENEEVEAGVFCLTIRKN